MFRPKRVFVLPLDVSEISFNPCSRGCFARRTRSRESEPSGNRFQSLFSWMFRPKSPFPPPTTFLRGFNPCSRGCFARSTGYDPSSKPYAEMFQSLFSWMFRPKTVHPSSRPAGYCFNPCSRGCFARRFHNLHTEKIVSLRFNPCSRGCFARRIYCATQAQDRNVSILVLVDVSPEGPVTDSYAPSPTVSILVLVDVSPEAAAVLGTVSAPLFQSLFSWMFRPKTIFYI